MLEIEMKFPEADFARVRNVLVTWQAGAATTLVEADHYFNAPDRDFACTDEAFRMRRIGPSNRLTYKGPKQTGLAKTRLEIEVPLADGNDAANDMINLIERLGYRAVAIVRKTRQAYRFTRAGFDLEVCLDDVDRVGRFVEVEIVAPDEQRAAAEKTLQEVARELGLQHSERRSYLEMLLSGPTAV